MCVGNGVIKPGAQYDFANEICIKIQHTLKESLAACYCVKILNASYVCMILCIIRVCFLYQVLEKFAFKALTYVNDSSPNIGSVRWQTLTRPSLDQHICKNRGICWACFNKAGSLQFEVLICNLKQKSWEFDMVAWLPAGGGQRIC